MTKKSFKRSEPALAFISGAEEEKRPPKAKATSKPATKKASSQVLRRLSLQLRTGDNAGSC